MVISDIWSIVGWDRFPYTKIYLIYGQISDIWSEIQIKSKTKDSVSVANLMYFQVSQRPCQSRVASDEFSNPII